MYIKDIKEKRKMDIEIFVCMFVNPKIKSCLTNLDVPFFYVLW